MSPDASVKHMTTPRRIGSAPTASAHGSPERLVNATQVDHVREAMPPASAIVDLADVFDLLGEPSRVSILIALLTGPMAVRDLAAVVELSESATSHALRLLRAHRVVDVHREGRNAYYALADSHVRLLLDLALEHVGHSILLHPTDPADSFAGDESCIQQPMK